MLLLPYYSLPIFTALVIVLYFYFIDPNREPVKRIIEAFMVGFAVSLQVDYLQNLVQVDNIFYIAFISAGLIEESVKLLALSVTLFRSRYFTQKIDGITYAVVLSLGFAVAENVFLIDTMQAGIVRAFTATPAHALFAVSMGFYIGRYKFRGGHYIALALIVPTLLHGVYNLFIMSGTFWGFVLFIPYMVFLWVKSLKRHQYLRGKVNEVD